MAKKAEQVQLVPITNINELAETILKQLYLMDMSYDDLSKQSGVSKPMISRVVNGQSIPSSNIVRKLAPVLKLDEIAILEMCFKEKMKRRNKKIACCQ